jgi:hypothetical protein
MQETTDKVTIDSLGMIHRHPDAAAIAKLMEELLQGDEAEHRETFEALKRGLDEHRPEGYKLFP